MLKDSRGNSPLFPVTIAAPAKMSQEDDLPSLTGYDRYSHARMRASLSLFERIRPRAGRLVTLTLACLATTSVACASVVDSQSSLSNHSQGIFYAAGQIIDTRTGQSISFPEWMMDAAQQDVIYLGEEHRNPAHIQAAVRVLEGLLHRERRPVLALEMFGWDGQAGLTQYLSRTDTSLDQFLRNARWQENWGGAFSDYEPLISFARSHSLGVTALNPPRTLVRQVAKQGLSQALRVPEMGRWGMWNQTFVDDPAYRKVIVQQVRQCHGGLSEEEYQRLYEASIFRDEGMAKRITDILLDLAASPDRRAGPVVSYTGGGHIQYQLPIPQRVSRRQPGMRRQMTVYLTSFDPNRPQDVTDLVKEGIADYVWLTPVGSHGLPRRCR